MASSEHAVWPVTQSLITYFISQPLARATVGPPEALVTLI
jgi:hypothetical protein